jgi:speckle-type POZ protein
VLCCCLEKNVLSIERKSPNPFIANIWRLAVKMESQEFANSARSTKTELMPAISSTSASYNCHTEGVINDINFKWTIERLAFLGKLGIWEPLTSTEFSDEKFKLEFLEHADAGDTHLVIVIHLIHTKLRCPIEEPPSSSISS